MAFKPPYIHPKVVYNHVSMMADGMQPNVIIFDEMVEYLTETDFQYMRKEYENSKGANEMNQKFIDKNGVTIYGYKPEEVVKAEKKREGKAEKLLKHLTEDEINYVKANPAILDALGKQASNPLYKRASKEMARTKAEQLVKASEKYPEPLNPESWTGEQLADHAFQEVFDLTSYITGMKIKFEKMTNDLDFHKEHLEIVQDAYNYTFKAYLSVIRQAQKWKKEYEEIVDILQKHIEKEVNEGYENRIKAYVEEIGILSDKLIKSEDNFMKCEDAYEGLHLKFEALNEDFAFVTKQKTELMNSNHRLSNNMTLLNEEKNQLYKDNYALENKVKDLEVEAKLWKDKFHLVKPLEEDKHNCKDHTVGVYVMNALTKVICSDCGKVMWDIDEK